MWPFSCDVTCCMGTLLEPAKSELEQSLERELLEAALRSAIENVHSHSGFQHRIAARDFPVRMIVFAAFFLLSGGIAAALIHSGVGHATDSLFRLAGF